MRCLGLTDDEMKEYENLNEKWRKSVMSNGPSLTAEEEERYQQLDKRTIYRFWPEKSATLELLIDAGLFVKNPAKKRAASLFFGPDEAKSYLKSHPKSRIWTMVEGDDGSRCLEQGWHSVNRIAYMIERC